MGKTQKLKERIERQRRTIREHEQKIITELARPCPNRGLIDNWRRTIISASQLIENYERRIKVVQKRGR